MQYDSSTSGRTFLTQLLQGGISGLVAAAPMPLAMGLLYKQLAQEQPYALPPYSIISTLLRRVGQR